VENFEISVDDITLSIHATLQPGQYISIPHVLEWACIYNRDHHVAGEVWLHGYLPRVTKGETTTISLTCASEDPSLSPGVIMNVHYRNGYFYQ
jgi:hypothetical protein